MLALRQRSILRVDPGNDFVTHVGVVTTGSRRIQELAAAKRGPTVHPDQDASWGFSLRKQLIGQLRKVLPKSRAVAPHIKLARQPLYHVNRWIAPRQLLVVARRQVDPQGPLIGVS